MGAIHSLPLTLATHPPPASDKHCSEAGRVMVYEEARIVLEDLLCAQQQQFLYPACRHCLPIEVLHSSGMDCFQTSNRRGDDGLK